MVVARVGSSCMLRRASVRLPVGTGRCCPPPRLHSASTSRSLADQPCWLHRRCKALCNHHFCSVLGVDTGPKRLLHSDSMHLCHACLPHLHVAGVDGGQPRQQAVAMAAAREAALLDALTCDPGA